MLEVVEMCLELVVDFERVVESIPQGNDTSTLTTDSPLPLSEDRSLVNNALTLLQVSCHSCDIVCYIMWYVLGNGSGFNICSKHIGYKRKFT